MRHGILFLALSSLACASTSPPASSPTPASEAGTASSVIVSMDPHSVMGCRLLTRTIGAYDIRDPEQKRKLQKEAARLGGNTVLISIKGDRKGEIFSCKSP